MKNGDRLAGIPLAQACPWSTLKKETNKYDEKQRLMDMDSRLVVIRGKEGRVEVDGVKRVKYVVTERNLIMGGDHTMQYIQFNT